MSTVVIRFKNGHEFSFKCESATFTIDKMSGKLCGYDIKGFDDKKALYIDLNDVEIVYSVLKEENK